jgi:hypothetical protein
MLSTEERRRLEAERRRAVRKAQEQRGYHCFEPVAEDGVFRGRAALSFHPTRCRVCNQVIATGEMALHSVRERGMAHVECGEEERT